MTDRYTGDPVERETGISTPVIVAALQLLGIVTGGIVNIVALVLAYVWRADPNTPAWAVTHHRFHIRTFWYSVLFAAIGYATIVILVGFVILALVALYVAIRTFVALARAARREPMPDPTALFW